ncbi:MAG: ABC-2 transporter permease [Acidobacteria bacterium]|nr:ABC-2 transporter permease [Acidobacteriota bacterium]
MRAAWAITTATVAQVLTLRRAIIFGVAALSPTLVYLLLIRTLSEEAALDRLAGMIILVYFPLLVPIISLIVASGVLGAERRDGTLSFLVLRPIPRWVIAAAKAAAAVIVAGGINAFGALALTVSYAVETGTWSLVVPLLVGGLLASIIYAAIFVPLGFFTDRAVLVGLLFVFVFENGIVTALTGLSALSPYRTGFSAFAALAPSDLITPADLADTPVELISLSTAVLWTPVAAVVSVALVSLVLRNRDLTSE